MVVFAFDRDWTVDVNPHPRKEAVPLEWVRHLAHETDHPVYAIGNQALADEAAIPGVVDIVGQHPDDWSDWRSSRTCTRTPRTTSSSTTSTSATSPAGNTTSSC